MLGDGLWAVMMYGIVGATWPGRPAPHRAVVAMLVCWSVELSQLYHAAWIDGLRRTTPGHLVLGSDYDPRDFVAYAAGIAVALLLERATRPRAAAPSAQP